MARRLASAYFAGAVAALAATFVFWLVAQADLIAALGVRVAPSLAWSAISERLLWGSLWALLFPFARRAVAAPLRAALLVALAPALAELFVFLPRAGACWLGVERGALMPVVVLAHNALWGGLLAIALQRVEGTT